MSKFINPPEEINTSERSLDSFFYDDKFRYECTNSYCKNKVVLDLGCGLGYGANLLSQDAVRVFGIDYSKATIKFAAKAYSNPKLSFLASDARALSIKSRTFDVVVAIEVFEHICESDLLLKEVKRVLKEKGIFIMSTPNKVFHRMDKIGLKYDNLYHINLAGFMNLKRILTRHFSSIKIWGIKRKGSIIYNFLRLLDFLNLRLLLIERQREVIKKRLVSKQEVIRREDFELREVNFLNAHTFQGFFVVCMTYA